jgi:hypothetical protein
LPIPGWWLRGKDLIAIISKAQTPNVQKSSKWILSKEHGKERRGVQEMEVFFRIT